MSCDHCGDETIHHIAGERPVDREHCFCKCHDWTDEDNHQRSGVKRDDEHGAVTACAKCRWAHAVAFSTANWRNDERYMQPPSPSEREG